MDWVIQQDEHATYTGHVGEAGLEPLMKELHQLRFVDLPGAERFAQALLGGHPLQVPPIEVTTHFRKRTVQGTYNFSTGRVKIRPHLRVGTLVHELAHHVQRNMPDGWTSRAHGRDFKASLRQLAPRARQLLGLRQVTKPRPRRLNRGQQVAIRDMDGLRGHLVKPLGRGLWQVETLRGLFRAHRNNLDPVARASWDEPVSGSW